MQMRGNGITVAPLFDQSVLFVHVDPRDDESIPLLNLSEKYRSSSLRAIDEIKLYNQLKKLMEVESSRILRDKHMAVRDMAEMAARQL